MADDDKPKQDEPKPATPVGPGGTGNEPGPSKEGQEGYRRPPA